MDDKQNALIAEFKRKPPLMLTFAEALTVLLPVTAGYKWGEDTIRDLWKMGAPTPNSPLNTPQERRIIFPGQLAKWLVDVLERQGLPLDASAHAWSKLQEMSR